MSDPGSRQLYLRDLGAKQGGRGRRLFGRLMRSSRVVQRLKGRIGSLIRWQSDPRTPAARNSSPNSCRRRPTPRPRSLTFFPSETAPPIGTTSEGWLCRLLLTLAWRRTLGDPASAVFRRAFRPLSSACSASLGDAASAAPTLEQSSLSPAARGPTQRTAIKPVAASASLLSFPHSPSSPHNDPRPCLPSQHSFRSLFCPPPLPRPSSPRHRPFASPARRPRRTSLSSSSSSGT